MSSPRRKGGKTIKAQPDEDIQPGTDWGNDCGFTAGGGRGTLVQLAPAGLSFVTNKRPVMF